MGLNLDVRKVLQLSSSLVALPSHRFQPSRLKWRLSSLQYRHYYCVSALEVVGSNSRSASFFNYKIRAGGGVDVIAFVRYKCPFNFDYIRTFRPVIFNFVIMSTA